MADHSKSKQNATAMSKEELAANLKDKNRRRKSIASQFAHPITGETMKERQVSI